MHVVNPAIQQLMRKAHAAVFVIDGSRPAHEGKWKFFLYGNIHDQGLITFSKNSATLVIFKESLLDVFGDVFPSFVECFSIATK